jgi:hypothetical protein
MNGINALPFVLSLSKDLFRVSLIFSRIVNFPKKPENIHKAIHVQDKLNMHQSRALVLFLDSYYYQRHHKVIAAVKLLNR